MMIAPITRISRSIVSQRGMLFAGFGMAGDPPPSPHSLAGPLNSCVICFTNSGKNGNLSRRRLTQRRFSYCLGRRLHRSLTVKFWSYVHFFLKRKLSLGPPISTFLLDG